MLKLQVKSGGQLLATAHFRTEQEKNTWLAERAQVGTFGEPGSYTTETSVLSEEEDPRWLSFRMERNARLAECDWAVLPDAPLTSTKKQKYLTYRQALRDLPSQPGLNPENPNWPKKP